jgi:hypothetical protein
VYLSEQEQTRLPHLKRHHPDTSLHLASKISCTENPKFFIEVLDELELFIYKKVIFDEKIISVSPPFAFCRLSANVVIRITFFPFNLDTSPYQVKVF